MQCEYLLYQWFEVPMKYEIQNIKDIKLILNMKTNEIEKINFLETDAPHLPW